MTSTTLLLWTLVALGAWNLINAIGRVFYRERQAPFYYWSILLGAWAAWILLTTV